MRSEHKSSGDEVDMRAGYFDPKTNSWRYWYKYVQRPGVRKKIKALSHRKDRVRSKQELRKEL